VSRNRQLFPTGTVHPCKCCGIVFTVEASPNRTGEFCSAKCAHTFAGRKPRLKATKAWRCAQREAESAAWKKDLADRAAAEEVKVAAILAECQRKAEEAEIRAAKRVAEKQRRSEEAVNKLILECLDADLDSNLLFDYKQQIEEEARRAPRPVRFWRRK